MKKIRKIFSRVTAAIAAFAVAATTIVSSFPPITAEAAKTNVTIGFLWGTNYNPYFTSAKYANSNGISGQYIRAREQVTRLYATDDVSRFLFCIEPSAHLGLNGQDGTGQALSEDGYTSYNLDSETASASYWNTNFGGVQTPDKYNWRKYFGLVQYYGYGSHRGDSEKNAYYVATQLLLWEMVLGYREDYKSVAFSSESLNEIQRLYSSMNVDITSVRAVMVFIEYKDNDYYDADML